MKHWLDDPLDPEEGLSDIEDMETVIATLREDWFGDCLEDDFDRTCISCRAGRIIKDLEWVIRQIHEIIEHHDEDEEMRKEAKL